jgi:DNA-nicking Smr family endonuclease
MSTDDDKLWKWFEKICDENSRKPISKKINKNLPKPYVLDLHNYTVQSAFENFTDFVENHHLKQVLIITGKSGIIKSEFEIWISNNKKIKSFVLKNGGGAYLLKLN